MAVYILHQAVNIDASVYEEYLNVYLVVEKYSYYYFKFDFSVERYMRRFHSHMYLLKMTANYLNLAYRLN